MREKIKIYLPYILFGLFIYAIFHTGFALRVIECLHRTINVQASQLDTYLGIVSGGIAIFSVWALVMTVFSITKIANIKETSKKVYEINKSMMGQHMLQLNYAGRHWSETILLCRQMLYEKSVTDPRICLYVRDTLIKTYIEVYSDLERQADVSEENRKYKDFLGQVIRDEMRKALEVCQKLSKKQKDLMIKNLQADIYFEKGCFEGLCGEYEDSITAIKKAISINEILPNYYRNLAVSQCLAQREANIKEAAINLKKAIHLSESNLYEAWFYNKTNILDVFDDSQWEKIGKEIKKKLVDEVCDGIDYRSEKINASKYAKDNM